MDLGFILFIGFWAVVILYLIKGLNHSQRLMERRTEAFEDMALSFRKIVRMLEEELNDEEDEENN